MPLESRWTDFPETSLHVPGDSSVLRVLPDRTVVDVVEVRRCDNVHEERIRFRSEGIRGRIVDPPGWISLVDLSNGYRWVAVAPAAGIV
eukprot:gene56728-biopygen75907